MRNNELYKQILRSQAQREVTDVKLTLAEGNVKMTVDRDSGTKLH